MKNIPYFMSYVSSSLALAIRIDKEPNLIGDLKRVIAAAEKIKEEEVLFKRHSQPTKITYAEEIDIPHSSTQPDMTVDFDWLETKKSWLTNN
jgi:hypothetical protein